MNSINPTKMPLTKKYLMSLETGCYLASNITDSSKNSIYEAFVLPPEQRETQWKEIKAAKADQVSCMVFANKEGLDEFLTQFN